MAASRRLQLTTEMCKASMQSRQFCIVCKCVTLLVWPSAKFHSLESQVYQRKSGEVSVMAWEKQSEHTYSHTTQDASLYLSVRWCEQCVVTQYLNEGQLDLHETKSHPNAVTRAPAKWHVSQLGTLGPFFFWKPIVWWNETDFMWHACIHDKACKYSLLIYHACVPLWVKLVWIWPVLWVIVENIHWHHYIGSLGYSNTVDLCGGQASAGYAVWICMYREKPIPQVSTLATDKWDN